MLHISTAFLIISITVINHGSIVTAQDDELLTIEMQNRAINIIDNAKYVERTKTTNQTLTKSEIEQSTQKIKQKTSSKLPNILNKPVIQNYYIGAPRPHYGHIKPSTSQRIYSKQSLKLQYSPNSIYKFPRVIPLPSHHRPFYMKKPNQPIIYVTSTGNPLIAKSPKFSLPQVINGIRTDVVKPPPSFRNETAFKPLPFLNITTYSYKPHSFSNVTIYKPYTFLNTTISTTTTTTAATTTTQRILRTKRIWPKHILNKANSTLHNATLTKNNTTKTNTNDEADRDTSESHRRVKYVYRNSSTVTTTAQPSTTRVYRPVTRKVKVKTTTPLLPINFTKIEPNDWVPIMPTHYAKLTRPPHPPVISKRSDILSINPTATADKQPMYLQTFGLIPVSDSKLSETAVDRKSIILKRKKQLNSHSSGYRGLRGRSPMHMPFIHRDLESEGSSHHHSHPHFVTKIKHHHHHHHHRYIKTVEKPVKVPYKVEVPKPYPIQIEKKVPVPVEKVKIVEKPVPYPVTVEKQIPYPIGIKIPQPVPVKVVEKEYVPKPYPVVQHVPVLKHVQVKVPQAVPVPVEKKVPYPVEVPVPVDRPVPVPVHVEKRVPYPVPVKVLVPQPYPVETKVPYPVEVKVREPVEVIKHVSVKVPYPQPYAVKVPHPVPVQVEKQVPYPVEVEKRVPVFVPHKVEVEKKVPVYVPRPYPVEKRVPVPYPVKVPYPVRVPVKVPVKVPVEIPVYVHHPFQLFTENQYSPTSGNEIEHGSSTPHSIGVQENTGYNGFLSRSDNYETTTAAIPSS